LLYCITDFMFVFILLFVFMLFMFLFVFVCVCVSNCVNSFACFSVHHCYQITKKNDRYGISSDYFPHSFLNKLNKKRFSWFWFLTSTWSLVVWIFSPNLQVFWTLWHIGILVAIYRASGVSKISVGTSLDRHLLCAEPLEC